MQAKQTLAEAKDGQNLTVVAFDNDEVVVQALRFGIDEGSQIRVQKNIPGGPVVISKHHLEIAIGREIARAIVVSVATPE
ncbi:MAG: ferrous iron transport protein A [Candidatus Obscuribacterales bacterium]|jgi:Fe2+ transport system protein FeoA